MAMDKIANSGIPDISISVVSHLQLALVAELLRDLEAHCKDSRFELILTLNLDETLAFDLHSFSFPIRLIQNDIPAGFSSNHNQAFRYATGRYFCVMNPDIRLHRNPFPGLLACCDAAAVGVVAPLVLSSNGAVEDSARRFPSPLKILCKAFGKCRGPDYAIGDMPIYPDWVAGMFMLFPRAIFERLGGFDEHYFLYYEDVDICARLRVAGYQALLCPQSAVEHHAQRSSHSDFRFRRLHLTSMARFFLSPVYWRTQFRAPTGKRLFDWVLAAVIGIVLALPAVLVALAVRLTSAGPILYWSDRVGRNNALFKMPKFRSMQVDTPAVATHLLPDPDAHLTPIGSFLRQSSLDELPQLWSIIKGDMSFVGPRPALFNQSDLIELRTRGGVHQLLPGLTGWAQINGRDELPIAQKVALDIHYLQSRTFWLDLKIIGMTVFRVLRRDNVAH